MVSQRIANPSADDCGLQVRILSTPFTQKQKKEELVMDLRYFDF